MRTSTDYAVEETDTFDISSSDAPTDLGNVFFRIKIDGKDGPCFFTTPAKLREIVAKMQEALAKYPVPEPVPT